MNTSLLFVNGGLCTTVQDTGRTGYQSLGIPVSGALDQYALQTANALVGNKPDTAALEIRLLGPTIVVKAERVRIALSGINTTIQVIEPERYDIPSLRSATLEYDTVFRIALSAESSCCYLAVEGGFKLEQVLGSFSTYLNGNMGGFEGRELRADDNLLLNLDEATEKPEQWIEHAGDQPEAITTINVIPGPQASYFTAKGTDTFYSSEYTVTSQLDRMGVRLDGPGVAHSEGFNIPSDGIVTGAIQVPGDGLPIILLADRQTTGGYPKIGCVISADLPKLAQLKPNSVIRFKAVTMEDADQLRIYRESNFNTLLQKIKPLTSHPDINESLLFRENLISGGEWLGNDE